MHKYYFLLLHTFSISRQSILSLLILCAFLCATLSHSAHSALFNDNIELQQCKLCQHNIDTPPNAFTVKLIHIVDYSEVILTLLTSHCEMSLYLVPQLRAPPAP
jgi:hypothetical protein